MQAVAFEDGKKKIRAALVFDTAQAREAQKQIEDQKLLLQSSTTADHQRMLMTFKQSNVKDGEQRIKHEVREADENVYKKGFIVDVNVQLVGGRPAGYRVTNLHQVIDLPE
ncbi:hypothetical protein HAP48_0002125 [Bradyrhizobium septentrionale]|uniref:Uncharacterized protein n=1 Tax=Bradyrhizobium septentrionale TaxID=1404411 RepID=A0A973W5D7_9BRAD|nr:MULTISPECIES: hypothetical protein [Bradyrhizobium]MCK7670851.1 hypothetical protein [Bradyrhizobium sp. 2S1]UGY16383.1 hypothetical protein HAP48_0002125 [Bradyrhizobium septentrionale]UGY24733.1 hypothetical protein HU675_0043735 [Bradyrhizobium septentrionale]